MGRWFCYCRPMTSISIQHNINQVLPDFSAKMNAKNMKFAVAKTLTNLAQEAQAKVRADMGKPGKLIIRRPWVVNGIRIKTAARDRLEAAIYSLDSGGRRGFMTRQEFGGVKTPEGGKHVAIPLKGVRPNARSIIPQYMKPKSLLMYGPQKNKTAQRMVSRAQAFKVKGKKAGQEWILIRKGGKVVPAWLLTPRAKIRSTNFLLGPTKQVVMLRANILLRQNAREAMKPRR